jgi:enediyne biosynthesis protein E4
MRLLAVPFLAAFAFVPSCSSKGPVVTGDAGAGGEPGGRCDVRVASESPTAAFFADVSAASGIQVGNFVSAPPTAIPINDHSRLTTTDIDGDGYDDIVMSSLFPNPQKGIPFEHLVFLSNHDGTFRDASDGSGLRAVQAGVLAFADVDNDGDQDCFAGLDIDLPSETSALYLNDGRGVFTKKAASGLEVATNPGNAAFADFNGDGKLDVFMGNGQSSLAVRNQVFFGNGDGTFRNVSASALVGKAPAQPSNGLVACDYDNDGDLDVFVSTYGVSILQGWNQLWENDGMGTFTNVAEARGFHAQATGNYWTSKAGKGLSSEPVDAKKITGSNGFGIDCQDINGDGLADILLATISHADDRDLSTTWSDPSQLLINQGQDQGFAFRNEYLSRGLPFNEGDVDAAAIDFDNDGRVDVSFARTDKYEGNYASDAQRGWLGLFRQLPNGNFEDTLFANGINVMGSKIMKGAQNIAWFDMDHDGDADLVVGGRDQGGGRPNYLFRNDLGHKNGWLSVKLVGDGVSVNRDAIGAKVTLRVGDQVFVRERKSSRGTYNSNDGTWLTFGVGTAGCETGKTTATMEVRWPNGKLETYASKDVQLERFATITYGKKPVYTER